MKMIEDRRLSVLRDYRILDTEPEDAFDRLTEIAAAHYNVPIALVSLVDESRQWFKSRLGLDVCQTAREISFCTHAIKRDEPLIVNDASKHSRFADNPLVTGEPYIRFYAGCPLIARNGARLGTLCIIDHRPRPDLQIGEIGILRSLAALVMDEMDLRLARERAEAENRAKSDFIATMSHELRTPLTSIMGYVELLQETKLDEHQSECLHLVRGAGTRLLGLLNDALDLSRVESGGLGFSAQEFSPAELVEHAVEFFVDSARTRGLDLSTDIKPSAKVMFAGDRMRVRQILFNLMSNAIKFTTEGEVSVACEVKSDADDVLTLYLTVTDTGIGIPDDVQAIVFDRFSQGDSREIREHYGAGLGLAICRELVDAMNGAITVEKGNRGGSCFRVVIPAAAGSACAATEDSTAPGLPNGPRSRLSNRPLPAG